MPTLRRHPLSPTRARASLRMLSQARSRGRPQERRRANLEVVVVAEERLPIARAKVHGSTRAFPVPSYVAQGSPEPLWGSFLSNALEEHQPRDEHPAT